MSKGAETRQAIVDHATRLASAVGLGGLSIGSLAEALGLSKSGLFAHFRSKERLQIEVLENAAQIFVAEVVLPAIKKPRGEPRVRELFDRWLKWADQKLPGGCVFISAAAELDDKPGPVRDALIEKQEAWLGAIERAAGIAVEEGHFQADLDTKRFAFELYGIMLSAHHYGRLLEDPQTKKLARAAFAALLERAQRT